MIENIQKIMDHYDLRLISTHRGRGAVICETNYGIKLLKELEISQNKAQFEYYIKKHLINSGYKKIDQYCLTKEGKIICDDEDNTSYILKDWYVGSECDFKDKDDILLAVENLAKLHIAMKNTDIPESITAYSNLGEIPDVLKKHNSEIKKVRNFIREKGSWTDFEIVFLQSYKYFYDTAVLATNNFNSLGHMRLIKEASDSKEICHGNYNHHNIIFENNKIATVNFEKCSYNIQVMDLYHLMRKVMEKNWWDINLGMSIIEEYDYYNHLDKGRLKYLYLMLLYPEKYWKIANYYYNTRKSWLTKRSLDKLQTVIDQKNCKEIFLKALEKEL